mmetsp:Transcript_61909/g.152443  ORF Transcript_61909/g.152443 Transcript_61909/m.152443 type:complete len:247 (-) Transcript_61909:760-1500(-)
MTSRAPAARDTTTSTRMPMRSWLWSAASPLDVTSTSSRSPPWAPAPSPRRGRSLPTERMLTCSAAASTPSPPNSTPSSILAMPASKRHQPTSPGRRVPRQEISLILPPSAGRTPCLSPLQRLAARANSTRTSIPAPAPTAAATATPATTFCAAMAAPDRFSAGGAVGLILRTAIAAAVIFTPVRLRDPHSAPLPTAASPAHTITARANKHASPRRPQPSTGEPATTPMHRMRSSQQTPTRRLSARV